MEGSEDRLRCGWRYWGNFSAACNNVPTPENHSSRLARGCRPGKGCELFFFFLQFTSQYTVVLSTCNEDEELTFLYNNRSGPRMHRKCCKTTKSNLSRSISFKKLLSRASMCTMSVPIPFVSFGVKTAHRSATRLASQYYSRLARQ
jgi:hypothetical protein